MAALTGWVLAHKRIVLGAGSRHDRRVRSDRAGGQRPLAAVQHSWPGGLRDEQGARCDLRQRRRRRADRPRRATPRRYDRGLARRPRGARCGAGEGRGRAAGGDDCLLCLDRRSGVRLRRWPHHLRARLHPGKGGVDPGQEEARAAQAALAGVTVGGAPVEVTGLDALRASAGENEGSGTGVVLGTLLAALGALLVLAFVFRSFMAFVPLLMALVAIPTTFLLVWPLASVTDVSVIVQFLVALIGLGIAIDYALLIVVRWREERQQPGVTNEDAVRKAMQHAGSAVVFSGTTVAISLLALLVLPVPFMRSIGIAGLMIALVSVAVAVTLLPVVLATIGPQVRLAPEHARRQRQPCLVGLGTPDRAPPLGRGADIDGRARGPGRRLLDPAREPARRLARKGGPARAGPREAGGLGDRHRPALAVRRARPLGRRPRRRGGAQRGRGRPQRGSAAEWRRDGTAIVVAIPTADGNSPAGRETLDRLRADGGAAGRGDDRRRGGAGRRLPRGRLRQLPADARADLASSPSSCSRARSARCCCR